MEIKILAEIQANPQICKFTLDRSLYPGRSFHCPNEKAAASSPLLKDLFAIEGVGEVLVSENYLSVLRSSNEPWQSLGKKIGQSIRNCLAVTEHPIASDLNPEIPPKGVSEALDTPLSRKISAVIHEKINPAIAGHGGNVTLVGIDGGDVTIRFGGGCQGCGMAAATLKNGVENMLKESVPEIKRVLDVTDHAHGTNPYFK